MDAVHPRYQGLKKNIQDSEVLASQYAAETMKISNTVEKEEFEQTMKDWNKLFLQEGLTVSNENIGVFSEVTLLCEETGQKDLAGRFGISIINAMHQIARQYMTSMDILERLEGISDRLYSGVDKLEKHNDSLSKIIPKKKILVAKKKLSQPSSTSGQTADNTLGQGPLPPGQYTILADKGGNTVVADNTVLDKTLDEELMETETPTAAVDIGDDQVPMGTKLDPMSQRAKQLRDQYRAHYGDNSFSAMPTEKQVAALEYYMTDILGLSEDIFSGDTAKYHMICDLVDKNRVLTVCEAAKTGEITASLLADSVEEVAYAINACHEAYGDYGAIALKTGDITKLHIS